MKEEGELGRGGGRGGGKGGEGGGGGERNILKYFSHCNFCGYKQKK